MAVDLEADLDDGATTARRWSPTPAQRLALRRARWRTAPLVNQIAYVQHGGVVNGAVVGAYLDARADPRFRAASHVWVVKSEARARALRTAYGDHKGTTFVMAEDEQAIIELYRSRTVITDDILPRHFAKRDGQRVIHMTNGPRARAEHPSSLASDRDRNRFRTLAMSDVLLVPSDADGALLAERWRLDEVYRGLMVTTGPWAGSTARLGRADIRLSVPHEESTPLVVVALSADAAEPPRVRAAALASRLRDEIGDAATIVTVDAPFADREGPEPAFHVRPGRPTDAALTCATVVVTDSASLRDACESRGQAVLAPLEAHARAVMTAASRGRGPRRDDAAARKATLEAIAAVHAGGALPEGLRTPRTDRLRILIHAGAMNHNGITTAAHNLISALGSAPFDVSVNVTTAHSEAQRSEIAKINSAARVILTHPGRAVPLTRSPARRWLGRVLPLRTSAASALAREFAPEWRRTFGDCEFDVIVDFSGYSPWYAATMLAGTAPRHLIWLHNDMARERGKRVVGDLVHRVNLRQTISLYRHFDELVSVSETLRAINRENLARSVAKERFSWAPNLLGDAFSRGPGAATEPASHLEFLAVGRLSPEKNHARLIRAFAQADAVDGVLTILGEGPLRAELEALASSLGVRDRVEFAGHQADPLPFYRRATCLVMASDHEGLPMAILEARALGLPVVATRFATAAEAVPASAGVVVDSTDAALALALTEVASHGISATPLDVAAYDATALAAFTRLVLGADGEAVRAS